MQPTRRAVPPVPNVVTGDTDPWPPDVSARPGRKRLTIRTPPSLVARVPELPARLAQYRQHTRGYKAIDKIAQTVVLDVEAHEFLKMEAGRIGVTVNTLVGKLLTDKMLEPEPFTLPASFVKSATLHSDPSDPATPDLKFKDPRNWIIKPTTITPANPNVVVTNADPIVFDPEDLNPETGLWPARFPTTWRASVASSTSGNYSFITVPVQPPRDPEDAPPSSFDPI